MDLEILLISNLHKRNFSKALIRIRPSLIDLKDRLAAISLQEPLTHVVALLSASPTTNFRQHYEGLTSRFSFAAGFGQNWRFHVTEDAALLAAIGRAVVTALQRSILSQAGQAAISDVVETWICSLPENASQRSTKTSITP